MAAVLSVACKPDPITPEDPAAEIKITGATSTITLLAEAVPVTFKVKGNYDWTAEVEANKTWIDVSPLTGKANEEVTVQVTAENNTEAETRTAKITFKIAEKNYSVEINATQLGKEGPDYDTHTKGYSFWSEDFNWITEMWPEKLANSKYGWISVKTDGSNYNEYQFGAAGYEAQTAKLEELGMGYDNTANLATYARYEGYIKLGKTKWVGHITSPALEGIDEATLATLEVQWDASLYVAANGNASANAYQKISVIGEGTIAACGTEGATISEDGKTATVPVLYEGEYLWRWVRKSIIVKDATAETKIQFGMIENLDARSFIDNLSVVRTDDEGAVPAADVLLPLAELDYAVGASAEEPAPAEAGAGTWTVRVNRGWTVEANADWVTITKVACNTDANGVTIAENAASATVPATGLIYKVYYNIAANEATAAREAKLTVKAADGTAIGETTIKQAGYVAPAGTISVAAKWSWTALYSKYTASSVEYVNSNETLYAVAENWVNGDHIYHSDVVTGGEFTLVANAGAAFTVGTGGNNKDRLRAKNLTLGDYFEFKVKDLTLKAGDIIRLKNAGFGTTSIANGVTQWHLEYSFDGATFTKVKDITLTGANKVNSIELEATAPAAMTNGTFTVRVVADEEMKGNGSSMLMVWLTGDANITEKDKYYTEEDWAFIYFETEKF